MTDNNKKHYQTRNEDSPFALTSGDLRELAKSTITPEMAEKLGIWRVDDMTGRSDAGKSLAFDGRDFAGVTYQYWSPFTDKELKRRLRRDNPDTTINASGELKQSEKYTQHYYDNLDIYYPMLVPAAQYLEWLMDPSIPIVSTEGEKKSACLFRIALERMTDGKPLYVVMGLQGVNCYRGKIGKVEGSNGESVPQKDILEDFVKIPLKGRKFTIINDADIHTNQRVKAATNNYAREMFQLGAQAYIAEIPLELELKACDDIAYALGDDKVLEILAGAKMYELTRPKRETTDEKIKRGAALRMALSGTKQSEITEQNETAIKKLIGAKTLKRLLYVYVQCGKLTSRDVHFLLAIHALLGNKVESEFYYADLHDLMYVSRGVTQGTINQRIRDCFERLEEAQANCGIRFVSWRSGIQSDGENYPSFVKLLIYEDLEQIENLAIVDKDYARNKFKAFQRASAKYQRFTDFTPKPDKRISPHKQIENGWQRVKGNIRTTVEKMQTACLEDWTIAQDLAKTVFDSEIIKPELMQSPDFVKSFVQHLPEDFKTLLLAELLDQAQFSDTPIIKRIEVCPVPDSPMGEITPDVDFQEEEAAETTQNLYTSKPVINTENKADKNTEIYVSTKNQQESAENKQVEIFESGSARSAFVPMGRKLPVYQPTPEEQLDRVNGWLRATGQGFSISDNEWKLLPLSVRGAMTDAENAYRKSQDRELWRRATNRDKSPSLPVPVKSPPLVSVALANDEAFDEIMDSVGGLT